MNKIIAISKKELNSYFRSPVAYIVMVLMISVFNIFFFAIIDENREASLVDIFKTMEFMFVFFLPLVTMKTFSEEKSSGTIEFLMTSPVTNTQIVIGKYLGSLMFFSIIIGITFVYYAIIAIFGHPDLGSVFTGYAGIWLEGAFFLSIGMLASSWTKNQIIAAVTSYAFLLSLYSFTIFAKYFNLDPNGIIKYFSTYTHAQNFFVGVVAVFDIIYYISGILVMIILTRISIENRQWK